MKTALFAVGLGLLLIGAHVEQVPDWDIGLSVLMAALTYLSAERTIAVLWGFCTGHRNWPGPAIAAMVTWFTVDGSYWLYWSLVNPDAMIRESQWLASLCLYAMAGVIWFWIGREFHQRSSGPPPLARRNGRLAP